MKTEPERSVGFGWEKFEKPNPSVRLVSVQENFEKPNPSVRLVSVHENFEKPNPSLR